MAILECLTWWEPPKTASASMRRSASSSGVFWNADDTEISESELKATFACFDTDSSGSIDLDELQQALGRFGKAVSKEEVETIVRAVDQNSDGEIDFEEFKAIFKLINASPAPAPEPEPEAAAHSKANGSEDGSAETAGASGDEGGTEGYTEVAQIADGAEDQKKDEVVPLALPSPVDILTDVLGGSDVAAASYARLKATTTATEERPVLLLKIEASLNLASPVNLSFLSPTSSDIFCLPPRATVGSLSPSLALGSTE